MDLENKSIDKPLEEAAIVEEFQGIEELESRYEYEDTIWLCKYTVHF